MAKIVKAQLEAEFKHNTSIGANGEILYDAPIEIKDQADLDNYGITWDDCRTLNFHGSEKVTVYFFKTENRAFPWICQCQMYDPWKKKSVHQMPGHRLLCHLPLQGQEAGSHHQLGRTRRNWL